MVEEKEAPLNFESSVEDVGPCKKKIRITVSKESVSDRYEKDFSEIRKTMLLPGFRKGHVPKKLLERKVGKELVEDLKEAIAQECMQKVLEERDLKPLVPFQMETEKMDLKPEEPFQFEITLEVKPDFELGEYTGIPAQKPQVLVSDGEVDEALEALRRRTAIPKAVEERGIESGDFVLCNAEFMREGEILLSKEGCRISSRFRSIEGVEIPKYDENIVGKKVNDEVTLPITLPENFLRKDLGGKEAQLRLQILEVNEILLPEVSDEWAKKLDYENLEELRKGLEKSIRLQKDKESDRAVEDHVIATLLEGHPFDLPVDLVEREAEEAIVRMKVNLQLEGKSEEEIEGHLMDLRQRKKEEIIRDFKKSLLLEKIAEKEKIYVTEEEMDECLLQIAYSQGQNPQAVREYFENNNLIGRLRLQIRERKVRDFLRGKAHIQPAEGEKKKDE